VRQVFFNLPRTTFDRVLADYRKEYGDGASAYAKKAYEGWKTGKVQMSGEVSERILAIVPRYLDFGVKYDLLEKLCRRREGTRLRIELTGEMNAREALSTALGAIENARSNLLPDFIEERLHWLSDHDGKGAQSLLNQVLDHEFELIVRAVQAEILRLLSLYVELAGRPLEMQSQREITLPGATVLIVLGNTSKHGHTRRKNVVNEQESPKPVEGSLVPVPNTAGQLAPIQSPQNLLEEALKRMTPAKQAEVLDKAAEEALRLQVKRKENEVDIEIVSDKIDQATHAAKIAENPDVDVKFETEHRSKQGNTHIKVTSKSGASGCLSVVFIGIALFSLAIWIVS